MSRRSVSVLVLALAFLVLLLVDASVPLTVFAGILFAVFLRGSGNWIAERTGLSQAWGLALFALGLVAVVALFLFFAAAALADQFSQLLDRLPDAWNAARTYVEENAWLREAMDSIDFQSLLPSGTRAMSTVSSTFGALGGLVVILFIGLYGAIDPQTYLRGTTLLFAPSLRPKVRAVLNETGTALSGWLQAQFISMTVVSILTFLGLWALGMPLGLVLAVLAALLTFIPNIGPILAAIPALLIAVSEGPSMVLWVAGLYVAVQTVESYLVTPQVQKEAVALPPALTISVQFLFGLLFGALGLAMATPFAAVMLRVGRLFYVEDYLDQEAKPVA
ncbi:MAG: AI-2E family transporter [Methylobacterium mesophilicum]|nr:AI-2E family transporter [Methylobacterium mesophilicum]